MANFISPLIAWASGGNLKNWAGNIDYSTRQLFDAASLEQVQNFVKKTGRFKVLGTRHCFNNIADSRDQFLSLQEMDKIVALNAKARTVTVAGRMTYGALAPYLDQQGFALHNLASLPHISVAGACSTGTHGSGEKNGNLSTSVSALEFVNASGDVVQLSRKDNPDIFPGTVVALGALGVITRVTLDVVPTFQMQQYVYENLPFSEMKNHFDAIQSAAYSVSLFTDWKNKNINEVWLKCTMNQGKDYENKPDFFGAKKATKNLHPISGISAENCTEQMGVVGPWYERLPHFKMGFTPSAGAELQSEFYVPRQHAVEAILAVERLNEHVSPLLLIMEIRAIAADDLWMSPCYRQSSITIHFTWKPDWPNVSKVLPLIEQALAPYHPRPHWGKLFTIPPSQLHAEYEKMPDFIKLAKQFDPQGKFRNEFLNKNIFTS
ncbi:MAG TPA: D-arabinono-1,4-lactone oxidase [Terriglobales bacterium]